MDNYLLLNPYANFAKAIYLNLFWWSESIWERILYIELLKDPQDVQIQAESRNNWIYYVLKAMKL